MPSYIAIQNTYEIFEMALFLNDVCVDHIQEDKRHTSKLFIPLLDQLLKKNNVCINDLDFCAVNCGPGPFSTLRSIIASVNGLHLATNIPLIGIDGLEATFLEFYDSNYANTVVLLNAFNNEVYYLIAHQDQVIAKGYKKIDDLLDHLRFSPLPFDTPLRGTQGERLDYSSVRPDASSGSAVNAVLSSLSVRPELVEGNERIIHFIGNGVTLYQDMIQEVLGNNAIIKPNNPAMCSVAMIGALGLEKWVLGHKPNFNYLLPLHLKKHAVEL